MTSLTIAAELTHRTLWYPTIQGFLVALCAVVLFFGSVYLLLGTNMGARLGFLVSFAGLMGFMVVLSLLWSTTAFPLNTLRGSLPAWDVVGVFDSLDAAPSQVRGIETEGHEADSVEAADVKARVDEVIVSSTEEGADNSNALFSEVDDFQITDTHLLGGSDPNLLQLQLTHTPLFAAATFCENLEVDQLEGLPPPEPMCDPEGETGIVVLERNLGSVRQPAIVAFVLFSVLFVLSLLCLHWYERDLQAARAAKGSGDGDGDSGARAPAKV